MEHPYFYLFVRQNLSHAQQLVQTNHATFEMARKVTDQNLKPSVVVIGVPDKTSLEEVMKRLERYQIPFEYFIEPDFGIGLSAVATYPLNKQQRGPMRKYKAWREENDRIEPAKIETADAPMLSV